MDCTEIPTIGAQGNYFGTVIQRCVAQNVSLVETWYPGGTVIPRHRHEYPNLFLLIDGVLQTAVGHERTKLPAGSTTFQQSDEIHEARVLSRAARGFNVELIGNSGCRLSAPRRGQALCGPVIGRLMRQLHYELRTDNVARELAIDGLAMQLIATIKREHKQVCSAPPVWLRQAKELLGDASNGRMNLLRLGIIMGIEPAEILRAFHTHVGSSPAAFYRSSRIAAACQRLIETGKPMTQVALEAGFYDQAHFSRCFKQATGFTPLRYRQLFGHSPRNVQILAEVQDEANRTY